MFYCNFSRKRLQREPLTLAFAPIEKSPSSGACARSQKVLGLRMFPYAFLLQENKGFYQHDLSYNPKRLEKQPGIMKNMIPGLF